MNILRKRSRDFGGILIIQRHIKTIIGYLLNFSPTRLIALGFFVIIMIGAILLSLPISSKNGGSIGFVNALFTATSAVCVTGLTVVDTYLHWTVFGQVIIVLLIQIGGLGFMTMATLFSFMLKRRISLRERLLIAESLNQYSVSGVVRLTQQILIRTLLFECIAALILSARFIGEFGWADGIYKGIFHSITAFCNSGFDLMGEKGQFSSLTSYVDDITVNVTVMLLVIIGGLGFSVWDDIYKVKRFKNLTLHSKLVLSITAVLSAGGFIAFFLLEYGNPGTLGVLGLKGKVLATLFQSVSLRTAGFNTIPLADMTNASKFLTMILMFIGGSPGSTAGGIKTTTVGVLIFSVWSLIKGKQDIEIFERRLNFNVVLRALSIVTIGFQVIVVGFIVLSVFENAAFIDVLFEVVSAFGTSGATLGVTPTLTIISKITLIMIMYFGRVGVLTIALALVAKSHNISVKRYRYPEEKVMVG